MKPNNKLLYSEKTLLFWQWYRKDKITHKNLSQEWLIVSSGLTIQYLPRKIQYNSLSMTPSNELVNASVVPVIETMIYSLILTHDYFCPV